MMEFNEKAKRRELVDTVADAGRLARGLDQLLETMSHADQLDPLEGGEHPGHKVDSERCTESSRTPRASWRSRTRPSRREAGQH